MVTNGECAVWDGVTSGHALWKSYKSRVILIEQDTRYATESSIVCVHSDYRQAEAALDRLVSNVGYTAANH